MRINIEQCWAVLEIYGEPPVPVLKNRGIPVLAPHTKWNPESGSGPVLGRSGGGIQVSVPIPVLAIRTGSSPVPGNRVQNCN